MKRLVLLLVGAISLGVAFGAIAHGPDAGESSSGELRLETLLAAELEAVSGTEVIISRVTVPPDSALPKHWHPGEEFAYVLEGAVTVWLEGEASVLVKEGGVAKVPLKKVHGAITGGEGATILVFRVHEKGEPERVLVD